MRETEATPWVFRPLVMAVMVGCIAWSVVELLRSVVPAWNGTFLVVGCALTALEANYSHRLLKTRWELRFSAMQFRLAELVVILVALKVGSYVGDGWASVLAEIQNWPYEPGTIFDPETLVASALALMSWLAVNQTIEDLERLAQPPEAYKLDAVPPMESLFQRFLVGGVILLIAAGFTRVAPAETLKLERPSVPGLVLNALIYFLMGLVMLGQTQLTRLRVQWQAQEIKVADGLGGRWARYSLTFIGLAALAALVLPTGYTSGVLLIVGLVIVLAFYALGAAAWLLVALLVLPLICVLSRLSGQGESTPEALLPPSAPATMPQGTDAAAPEWFVILRMLIFWAIVLGVLFYLFRRYLREHPELQESLVAVRPVQALRRGWAALWRWLRSWTARLGQTVGERLPRRLSRRLRRAAPVVGLSRFFRLGGLPPREQVMRYYANILRRAREQGLGRGRGQTPYEYQATLEAGLSQARQEIEGLTQAFVEARYSPREVEAEVVTGVRAYWARIKRALRRQKRRAQTTDHD